MEILLFDRSEKQIGRLLPELVSPTEIEDLSGEHRLLFSYPSDADWAESIAEGHLVACQDMDRAWQLYEIAQVRDQIGTVEAICEHAYYSLSGMEFVNATCEGSALTALTTVLASTGWEPGTVEIQTARTCLFEHMNPLAAITKIAEHWGGELRFRVAVSGAHITGRYVDLLTRRGDVTGKRFEFGRDIQDIDITVNRSAIVTALYGWGQGENIPDDGEETERLTFADVEWVKGEKAELYPGGPTSPAPCDKPLGQIWVGDDVARQVYGRYDPGTESFRHVFGEYESQAKSPQALLWETWRQLQKRNEPLVNIKATVADLEQAKVVEVRNKEGPKIIYSRSSPAIHPETGAEVPEDTPVFVDFAAGKKGSLMVEGTENLIAEVDSEEYIRTAGDHNFAYWVCYYGLEKSTTYTISFEAEFLEGQSDYITIFPYRMAGQEMSQIHIPYSSECRMTATFTTDDRYNYNLLIYAGRVGQTAGNRIKFKKTQLEKLSYSTPWHIGGGTRANPVKQITLTDDLPETFAVGLSTKMLHAYDIATRTFWECGDYRCYYDVTARKLKMTNGTVTAEIPATWNADDYVGVYAGRDNATGKLFIQAKIAGVTGDKAEVTGDAIASGTALYVASKADGEESINAVVADFVLHTGADIDPIGYLSAVPGGGGE